MNGDTKEESIDIPRYIPDTYIYRPSRIMKSLQYLTEVNVIRIWNDHIIELQFQRSNKENGLFAKKNDTLLLSD